MKRRKFKKQRARLRRLADKWIGPLGLGWWAIQHRYYAKRKSFAKGHGREALMRVTGDWRYRVAEICVNVPGIADQGDKELEAYYVHELMHLFLLEMAMTRDQADARDHEERTAKTLADAFLWVRGKSGG